MARITKVIACAFLAGAVFICAAVTPIVIEQPGATHFKLLMLLAPLGLGIAVALLLQVVGYRLRPLERDLERPQAEQQARVRFMGGFFQRLMLSETILLISVVFAFAFPEGSAWLVLAGCLISLILMALHVWPGRRVVDKSATALEREGVDSGLRQAFGMDQVIQEL